jgi:membrane protein CcdC involved in cytochrome C biogenesis
MNIKKLVVEFITVFVVALVTVALVTFLWNIFGHGESTVDWETSFRFGILFGIILKWAKSREIKEKLIFQKSGTTERGKS